MLELVEVIQKILDQFLDSEMAEFDLSVDVPDQTVSITIRRTPTQFSGQYTNFGSEDALAEVTSIHGEEE